MVTICISDDIIQGVGWVGQIKVSMILKSPSLSTHHWNLSQVDSFYICSVFLLKIVL